MDFRAINNINELLKYSKNSPKLWVDLDGVLVNFEKGFEDLGQGSKKDMDSKTFWKILSTAPRFFRDLEWMPDGEELWNHIKRYNPTILTAPVRESTMPHCKEDKKTWVKEHLGNMKIIIDSNKGNYANEGDILIDDKEENIVSWETADGVGILHTSTINTIKKLQRLL